MSEEIKNVKPEILSDEQEFYIPVELWDNNFFYIGTSYKSLQMARESGVTKHKVPNTKRIILKFKIKAEDFKEK